jgi:ADP-heptose:LPS heptosyltransferase
VLSNIPQVDEVLVVDPTGETAERARLVSKLRGRQFDGAIFALARREKSRWLAEAIADMKVPYRINLEYFDNVDIERSDLFTHEGWFFWCAIASARFLLHGLCPLVGQQRRASQSWLQDRCVTFPVRPTWRQEAKRVLAERGIGTRPFVLLTPGGSSSQRWPTRKFAALAVRLAEELGVHVIVEGGPADGALVERTMQQVTELQRSTRAGTRCVAAHDSLGVLAALLERSSLLVSNDSAPIHLAEATGTPTLYFSHHEKLTHSHPGSHSHWALYDLLQNRVANIPVDSALSTVSQMIERRHVALSGHPELGTGPAL